MDQTETNKILNSFGQRLKKLEDDMRIMKKSKFDIRDFRKDFKNIYVELREIREHLEEIKLFLDKKT